MSRIGMLKRVNIYLYTHQAAAIHHLGWSTNTYKYHQTPNIYCIQVNLSMPLPGSWGSALKTQGGVFTMPKMPTRRMGLDGRGGISGHQNHGFKLLRDRKMAIFAGTLKQFEFELLFRENLIKSLRRYGPCCTMCQWQCKFRGWGCTC